MASRSSERVRTPSRKARTSAEVDTPRTRAKKRLASALVGLTDVEEEAEEEDEPEFEDAEEGEEDEDEPVELSVEQRFWELSFESNWVVYNAQNKQIKQRRRTLKGWTHLYREARNEASLAGIPIHQSISRTSFRVYAVAMPTKDYWVTDIDNIDEYELVQRQALHLNDQGWMDLKIDVFIWLEKDAPLVPDTPVQTPAATPTTAGNIRPQKKARSTATSRQEAALEGQIADQEDAGDFSTTLRIKWVCAVQGCANNRGGGAGYCYWPSSNTKDGHYPLTQNIVKEWSKEIKDGLRTSEEPSIKVMELMNKARNRLYSKSHNHTTNPRNQAPQQQQPNQPIYNFWGVNPADVMSRPGQPLGAPDPPSSAPTETPPFEIMADLFRFAKQSIDWRGDDLAKDLDKIQAELHANGYDIKGIKGVSSEDWREMGLKRGQKDKFKETVDRYRLKRKERGDVSD